MGNGWKLLKHELILLADVENAEAFMQKLGLLYLIKKQNSLEANELALSLAKKEKNEKRILRNVKIRSIDY